MSYGFGSLGRSQDSSSPTGGLIAEIDALITERIDERELYGLENAVAWQWGDPAPQALVDFGAGLGDALTLTGTQRIREYYGIDGGVDDSSVSYVTGSWSSAAMGGARLYYMTAAKGYSLIAPSGVAASVYRDGLKNKLRPTMAKNWRKTVSRGKYRTDAELRAAAGRTNRPVNAYGAGVAYSGVTNPCYSDNC